MSKHQRHQRSVSVQTEGTVSPYPHGSSWLDSSSHLGTRSSGSVLVVTNGSVEHPRPGADDRSLDMHSMPSMWGPGASVSQLSMASDENYSIKSASYALPPPMNTATSKHKAMSKMRHNAQRQVHGPQFRDVEQILQDAKSRTRNVKVVVSKQVDGQHQSAVSRSADDGLRTRTEEGSSPQQMQFLGSNGSMMSIAGQGFVSPFSLPKL